MTDIAPINRQIQHSVSTAAQARLNNKTQALTNPAKLSTSAATEKNDPANIAQIEEAAKDFEAVFLTEMMRPMFDSIKPDPMFGGGKSEEVFKNMLVDEYGKAMVDAGGIGLAEHIKAEMIRIQEESQK